MVAPAPQTMTEAVAYGIHVVVQLLGGSIGTDAFLTTFGDLYDEWPMDGHESDAAGLELLASTSTAVAILGRDELARAHQLAVGANVMFKQRHR